MHAKVLKLNKNNRKTALKDVNESWTRTPNLTGNPRDFNIIENTIIGTQKNSTYAVQGQGTWTALEWSQDFHF